MKTRRSWVGWLCLVALLGGALAGCAALRPAQPPKVTPGACRVKTDMELAAVYSIPTNFHSRTLLRGYRRIPGGMTPATVRLQGGVGNVQLTPAWLDYVARINQDRPEILSYLFHRNSGWQNFAHYGRVEELVFENQKLNVLRVRGSRAYVQTYSVGNKPPERSAPGDLRQQLFTVVTRDDRIVGAPPGDAYIVLIARPGEELWLPADYLDCPARPPG